MTGLDPTPQPGPQPVKESGPGSSSGSRIESTADKLGKRAEELKEKATAAKDQASAKVTQTAVRAGEKGKQAFAATARTAREAGDATYDFVEENLFPIILISAGAAWLTTSLLRSSSKSSPRDRTDTGEFGDTGTRDTGSDIGEKAGDMTRRAKDAGQRVKEMSRRTTRKSKQLFTENALLIAGGCAALGVLIGLAVPETGKERRLYGEVREQM